MSGLSFKYDSVKGIRVSRINLISASFITSTERRTFHTILVIIFDVQLQFIIRWHHEIEVWKMTVRLFSKKCTWSQLICLTITFDNKIKLIKILEIISKIREKHKIILIIAQLYNYIIRNNINRGTYMKKGQKFQRLRLKDRLKSMRLVRSYRKSTN